MKNQVITRIMIEKNKLKNKKIYNKDNSQL